MSSFYNVKVKGRNGIENILVNATDEFEARKVGQRNGHVIDVKKRVSLGIGRPLSKSDRITLLRRLAMMTKSKVSITRALTIIHDSFSGKISETAKLLEQKIMKGDDIIEAMESLPADFPSSTVSLIKTGMYGGELNQALNDAANFEDEMYRVGRMARSGILSAAGEFVMAAILILVTAYWIGPWVMESDIMKAGGDAVNIDWAFWMAHILAALIILISLGSFSLFMIAYVFKPIIPNLSDGVTLKVPVFRDLVLSRTYYSVFYGLSLLIKSGVRLKDSLELAASNAPKGAIKSDLLRAVFAIEEGRPWASEMVHLQQTDRACLETSQDRSEISGAFMVVASYHKHNYATRVEQVVPVLSIVANIFMATAGFLIFAMTMLPNLQLTKGILQ